MRYDWLQATWERTEALKAGDDDAAAQADYRRSMIQDAFFVANRKLAMAASKEFLSRASYHLAEDYEQAALFGMWVAFAGDEHRREVVHRDADGTFRGEVGWDPSKSTFGGFSRVYIRGAVQRAVASSESGLSYGQWSAKPKVTEAVKELRETKGTDPTPEEIAEAIGMRPDSVRAILTPSSLSTETEFGDGFTLGDTLAAIAVDDADSEVAELVDSWVAEAARDQLGTVELFCLLLRRGLAGTEPLPIIDTAARLGVNRGKVTSADKHAWPKVESVMRARAGQLLGAAGA